MITKKYMYCHQESLKFGVVNIERSYWFGKHTNPGCNWWYLHLRKD